MVDKMFRINNKTWKIRRIAPNSDMLVRSDGVRTIGLTDGNTNTVYLANNLHGYMYEKVLSHEIVHCICMSYGITIPMNQEECIADWFSCYGREAVNILDEILGKVWMYA